MNAEEFEKNLKKTISPAKCREALVGSDYLSDVTFILGQSEEELKAHKFFLMTASPILHQLFTTQSTDDPIKISGISKETMLEVCRFAYSENVRFNQHNIIDILAAASKLKMNFLMEKTVGYIGKEGLNETTVFKILEANQKEKNMIINMKCFAYIEKNHQKCFKSNEFLQMSSELLRLTLQACKLPQTVAKEAVTLWSEQPDNSDDLDELFALISLNDYPDESTKTDRSDTESVGSHMSSRAGSNFGGNRRRPNQRNGNNSNRQPSKPSSNRQAAPLPRVPSNSKKNLTLQGSHLRKHFHFANLNLATGPKPISLNEIGFIYDLSLTDKDFQIVISDMTEKAFELFFDTVKTTEKVNGVFTSYVLPRPCEIPANRKIWISIEFRKPENRLSFDTYTVSMASTRGGLGLRQASSSKSNGQIIFFIGYDDV